jgi:hypothetical protein
MPDRLGLVWRLRDSVSAAAPGKDNEDTWGAYGSLAWVIDGATPLGYTRQPDRPSPVREFAAGVSRALAQLAREADISTDLSFVLKQGVANEATVTDASHPPHAAVGLVCEDGSLLTYALLADVFVVVGRDASTVVVDGRMTPVNQEGNDALAAELARGLSFAEAQQRIQPLLIAQRRERMNRGRDDAYWTLTPDPDTALHAVQGSMPRPAGTPVLICSDGFARLVVDAGAYTWPELIDAAYTKGLAALVAELRELEDGDPADGDGFLRISCHDDATAVLLE